MISLIRKYYYYLCLYVYVCCVCVRETETENGTEIHSVRQHGGQKIAFRVTALSFHCEVRG